MPNRVSRFNLALRIVRTRSVWAALLFAVGAGSAAADTVYVLTDAQSSATNSVDTEGSAEKNYNSTVGDTTSVTNFGASLLYTGSPNTVGLTSSFDSTSASVLNGGSSSAYAAADLGSGTLHAAASASTNGASSSALAEFADTLTLSIPGAGPDTITMVGVNITVDGLCDDRHAIRLGLRPRGAGITSRRRERVERL